MLRMVWFLICLTWAATFHTHPANAADLLAPVHSAITSYIIPNTERFSEVSKHTQNELSALCLTPSQETLDNARNGFHASILAFGRIEFLRLGPLDEDNRGHRLLFWPDRKSTGLRQVQRALLQNDASVTDVKNFTQKSVALQGFGALEFLLFGSGSEKLTGNAGAFRCRFSEAVAENISMIAGTLAAKWSDESGYQKIWTKPSASNPQYQSDIESLTKLVGLISNTMEIIKDQRLKPISSKGPKRVSFKRALFWRSEATGEISRANLEGVRDLIFISGLMQLLPQEKRWLAGSVSFEIDNALKTLSELEGPVRSWVNDGNKVAKLSYLIIVIRSLQSIMGEQVAEALNLPTTFSPLDGD